MPPESHGKAGGILSAGRKTAGRRTMRAVVVTGGNRGAGLAAARNLAGRGYDMILLCRDEQAGRRALGSLHSPQSAGNHRLVATDLASFGSVRAAAARIAGMEVSISALVNNAACLPVRRAESRDGFELQIAVNHLAHFLLTNLLLPQLRGADGPSRIITISSAAHSGPAFNFRDPNWERRRYRRRRAYQQSKLANVLFTLALARRVAGTGIQAVALHPGVYDTGLLRSYVSGLPGGGAVRRFVARDAHRAGPIVGELAAGRRGEDLNGLYFDMGVRAVPAKAARDPRAQERLWRWSAAATGLEPEFGEGEEVPGSARPAGGGGGDPESGGARELPLR